MKNTDNKNTQPKSYTIDYSNGVKYYILRAVMMYLFAAMTSMIAVFIKSTESIWAIIFSILLIIPNFLLNTISARTAGEESAKASIEHRQKFLEGQAVSKKALFMDSHWTRGIFVGAVYAVPQIIILLIGMLLGNSGVLWAVRIFNMPVAVILIALEFKFNYVGILNLLYLIPIILNCIAFEVMYVLSYKRDNQTSIDEKSK